VACLLSLSTLLEALTRILTPISQFPLSLSIMSIFKQVGGFGEKMIMQPALNPPLVQVLGDLEWIDGWVYGSMHDMHIDGKLVDCYLEGKVCVRALGVESSRRAPGHT
jgi:hypothetical protein